MDVVGLIDNNGLAMTIAILNVIFIAGMTGMFLKLAPKAFASAREFIKAQTKLAEAMEKSAKAMEHSSKVIKNNTEITKDSYKQSESVLEELQNVSEKFTKHDYNALEIKSKMDELILLVKESNCSGEVLKLLKELIEKLELKENERNDTSK